MVLQEYPEDGAASSDGQMLLSFEEFKQIMDEWDVIPIFVNPHKFAQHKQVSERHVACSCRVSREHNLRLPRHLPSTYSSWACTLVSLGQSVVALGIHQSTDQSDI